MKNIEFVTTYVSGACGVGTISNFSKERHWNHYINKNGHIIHEGGCGWLLVGFISRDICKEVYTHLIEHHPLVYQSPVRYNKNSNNQFFFCIFDTQHTGLYGFNAIDNIRYA